MRSPIKTVENISEQYVAKFWQRVDKSSPNSCWTWTANLKRNGYGRFYYGVPGQKIMAHRASFFFAHGYWPECIDHLCRNHACVNPAHLEDVTPRVNVLRGETIAARNAATTHCPHGHELTGKDVYFRKDGGRNCSACAREYGKRKRSIARTERIRLRTEREATLPPKWKRAACSVCGGPRCYGSRVTLCRGCYDKQRRRVG